MKFPFDSIHRYHHFTIHFELNFKKQRYCKIPIIRPWFIFVLRFFLIHLFSGKLIFGVCFFRGIERFNCFGLDNKHRFKY